MGETRGAAGKGFGSGGRGEGCLAGVQREVGIGAELQQPHQVPHTDDRLGRPLDAVGAHLGGGG